MLFPDTMIDEWILGAAALLIALGVLYRFGQGIYRGVQRIEQTLGVDDKGRTITERLDSLEKQMFPNGGESLSDKMTGMEIRQSRLETKMATIEAMLSGLLSRKDTNA